MMSQWITLDELEKKRNHDPKKIAKQAKRMQALLDGVKLSELRQSRRFTQSQMAKKLKIDQSNVSRIERGNFDAVEIRTLRRYVEALGGELEIRVRIDDVSQRLIDSEYEKKVERKLVREEAAKKRKKRKTTPAKSTPRAKSVAKRRSSRRVTTRAMSTKK